MPFDPNTATLESRAPSFDAGTALADFDPSTAEPEDAPVAGEGARSMAAALRKIPDPRTIDPSKAGPGGMTGADFVKGGLGALNIPLLPEETSKPMATAIKFSNPVLPLIGETGEGISQASAEFMRSLTSPLNLIILHGLGEVHQAAKAGSTLAKVVSKGTEAAFGAQMAQAAGTQAGEAVDVQADPNATVAQKAAAWTSPVLSGSAGFLIALGLAPTFAKMIEGKHPSAAVDTLNKAVKEAPNKEAAEAAAEARDKYTAWWQDQFQRQDRLLKSPRGAGLLSRQLSVEQQRSQRLAKEELQRKIDEAKTVPEAPKVEEKATPAGPPGEAAPITEKAVPADNNAGEKLSQPETKVGEFDPKTAVAEDEIVADVEMPDVEPNSESAFARGPMMEEPVESEIPTTPPTAEVPAPAPKAKPATTLKPLPADTEFLYAEGKNRYFQIERTAENTRGRTVDVQTLEKEGFDTSSLPKPKPAAELSSQANQYRFKRSDTFDQDGEYRIQTKNGVVSVFRDPENGWWYDKESIGQQGHPLPVGFNRTQVKEALEKFGHKAAATGPETRIPVRTGEKTEPPTLPSEKKPAAVELTPAEPAPIEEMKSTPTEAKVDATEKGPEITPTPKLEGDVSKMADKKALQTQKKFILDSVKAAIEAAPEESADLLTIHVPDDGTFRVGNYKAALTRFQEIIAKRFGKSFSLPVGMAGERGRVTVPPPTTLEPGSYSAPEARGVPRLNNNPSEKDVTDAVGLSVSEDPNRFVLQKVVQEGSFTIATDGRRMTVALGGKGVTQEKGVFPNWQHVVPKEVITLTKNRFRVEKDTPGYTKHEVDTEEMSKLLDRAEGVLGEKANSVGLYDLGNGEFGLGAENPEVGHYASEGVKEGMLPAFRANPKFLKDAMAQARAMGAERVSMYSKGLDDGAMVITDGKKFFSVVMPVRGAEEGPFGAAFDAAAEKYAPKEEPPLAETEPDREIAASIEEDAPTEMKKPSGEAGFVDPKLLTVLAGGGSGAAYGYSQGSTPEERIRKAIEYGATGAILGYLAGKIPDAFSTEGGAMAAMRGLKNTIVGKDLPIMRASSESATDAAFRLANARIYGRTQGLNLAAQVLGDKYQDRVFAERLGSVLVQEMQEAKLVQLADALAKAKTAKERAEIRAHIANVKNVWDMPASQIGNATEFRAALADPEIQAAIQRHKTLVQAEAEASHKALGGKLAAVGPNTGAFINTEAIIVGEGMTDGVARGNLQNPLKRKSAFGKERTGTADQYEIDYNNQVARMAAGNAERVALHEYYAALEEAGLAKRLPPGERPDGPDSGKFRRERTQELSTTGQIENTWIRKDIFGEHRQLMNTDSPLDSHLAVLTAKVLNTIQLKSLTDPTFHVANIISSISGSPGGKGVMADIGRKIPGVDVTDALVRITSKLRDVAADTPEIRAQAAEIARIGALREGHSGPVHAVDEAGRLVMNSLYDNLVERGLAPDREGPRRDFINQVGQYNTRLMGKTKAFMKEAGFSPFIVAGQNFNRLALKRVTMAPGATPANKAAAAKMIATNLAGLAVIGSTIASVNYLISGKPDGPAGTPVGAVGWMGEGENGKQVLHIVDPLKWTNMRRGLRITGANALLTGSSQGRDLNHIGGQAIEDIKNGIIHPWAGPAVDATSVLMTGKSIAGFQEAERANPLDRTNTPTLDQAENNAIAAGSHLNPHVAAFLQGGKKNQGAGGFDLPAASKGIGKSLLQAAGIREANPGDEDRGAAESALYAKEVAQSERTAAQQTLAERWAGLNKQQRVDAVKAMLREAEQTPQAKLLTADELGAFRANQVFNLADDVAAVKAGVGNSDRMAKNLGVEDGSRARYLADRIMARPDGDAQRQYIRDQAAKGNLTADVADQLVTILSQRGWKKTW